MSSNTKLASTSSRYTVNNEIQNSASSKKMNYSSVFTLKNKILSDLTRAIQLVQKGFLDNEKNEQPLTNSDYCVHELCQQFDNMFQFGLKKGEDGYWKLAVEFTHRNVLTDLKRLLNVNTSFGMGRAWIYHALNENLMESYLKCFLDDKKLVLRYYFKDQTLFLDDQIKSVLVTLVAGLENVEFKLYSDVPYLDHTCWPTHFNTKRLVVDSILNASPGTISQLASLKTINSKTLENNLSNKDSNNMNAVVSKTSKITITKKHSRKLKSQKGSVLTGTSANSQQRLHVNNISFDVPSPNSSNNNLALDGDSLSTCGSESGRFTATNNTTSPSSLNTGLTLKNYKNLLNENNLKDDKDLKDDEKRQKFRNNYTGEYDDYENETNFKSEVNLVEKKLLTTRTLSTSSYSIDYENEIDKLRRENNINIENNKLIVNNKQKILKSKSPPNKKKQLLPQRKHSNIEKSFSNKATQDLADSSLTISKSFDIKIKHLENSLKTIENATFNMDAFVNDMTSVYQDYDEKLCNESQGEEEFNISGDKLNKIQYEDVVSEEPMGPKKLEEPVLTSVYDMEPVIEVENLKDEEEISSIHDKNQNSESSIRGLEDTISMQSINSNVNLTKDTPNLIDRCPSESNISVTNINNNDYLAKFEINKSDDLKQEIKVDNNTKLMIMIDIFEHGEDEKLIKFYHAARGHNQGEIEPIQLLISSYGLYILIKNEITSSNNENKPTTNKDEPSAFVKESFINQKQIDYIEVSLEAQAIHLVFINKRLNCWITFACRNLTERFLENLQLARQTNNLIKPALVSVFREATQQKLSVKKFIANEENISNNDVELKSYSLVHFEDQASATNYLIHKEGSLWFLNKGQNSGSNAWKKAYFVLKNDVLTKYRNPTDKRPLQIIKLNGEDFAGCRRNTTLNRPNTIELILSNSNAVYLSAKSKEESTDWLQCFCKIISLGNLHSNKTENSCLPCCSIITASRIYFCHEDLNTGFYRLLEMIRFEEINRISFDNENPYFCILHDDTDGIKNRFWFVYFMDELERNTFIAKFKESWDILFQVPLLIEKCQSSETRKRCLRSIQLLHKEWSHPEDAL